MDNGARNYRRFLEGYDNGIVEIVEEYKDPLILYLNSYVKNIYTAEELAEDTFFKLMGWRTILLRLFLEEIYSLNAMSIKIPVAFL